MVAGLIVAIVLVVVAVIIFAVLTAVYFVVKKLKGKKLSSIQLILISAFLGILISLIAERI